jgi:DNA-binding NarL/FixJ family response regulator
MSTADRPRVLLAEDHTLVREGMRQLLAEEFEVVDAVEDGRALLLAAERLRPDVIILDISMPKLNGLDAARQLVRLCPASRLLFVTIHADPAYVQAAFEAGGHGYVVKSEAAAQVVAAVRTVMAGQRYLAPTTASDPRTPPPVAGGAALHDGLTARQREILQLVAEGRTAREIGTILTISRKTVEFHKSSIMRLLDLRTTADLTRYALARGIITST